MNRTDPTFKHQTLTKEEENEFLDELFAELFDLAPIDSDTDKIPSFNILTRS